MDIFIPTFHLDKFSIGDEVESGFGEVKIVRKVHSKHGLVIWDTCDPMNFIVLFNNAEGDGFIKHLPDWPETYV